MRFVRGNSIDIYQQLESWYRQPGAQYLFQQESMLVDAQLDKVFGYHLLQLGLTRQQPLGWNSGINHKIYATSTTDAKQGAGL